MALTGRQDYYISLNDEAPFLPLCNNCRHRFDDGITCEAFPEGIPMGVLTGQLDHTKNISGDNGIKFEPKLELIEV